MEKKICSAQVDPSNDDKMNFATHLETKDYQCATINNKYQALIARIFPDGHMEYSNVENRRKIRSRCHFKVKKS